VGNEPEFVTKAKDHAMTTEHQMKRRSFLTGTALAAVGGALGSASEVAFFGSPAWAQSSAVKPATEHTKAANRKVLESLDFNDRRDFEDARRGFVAELPGGVIRNAEGKVAFSAKDFQIPA
jgi:hypothetical protein